MSKNDVSLVFDYASVEPDTKGKLIRLAGQIKRSAVEHVEKIFELGEAMAEAHELLAGDGRDGKFRGWVEAECGFSERTAYNYLYVFQRFGKKLATSLQAFTPTALYALSAPKTPPEATAEAVKQAAKSGPMDAEQAEAIINKYREKKPPKKKPAPAKVEPEEHRSEGADEPDYGKCPNCAGTKWDKDDTGVSCAKCHHPHGEPVGNADDDRIATQRSKTVKTVEALMRAFDDLHHLVPKRTEHKEALALCKQLLKVAKEWK